MMDDSSCIYSDNCRLGKHHAGPCARKGSEMNDETEVEQMNGYKGSQDTDIYFPTKDAYESFQKGGAIASIMSLTRVKDDRPLDSDVCWDIVSKIAKALSPPAQTDWRAIAEQQHKALIKAKSEIQKSGNWVARAYGWPDVRKDVDAALFRYNQANRSDSPIEDPNPLEVQTQSR